MRILLISQFYAPIVGGEEQIVQDLAVELVGRGHQVAVATLSHPGLAPFEEDRGVRIYRIQTIAQKFDFLFQESERRHAPPWPDPEAVSGLRRIVARECPEILHAHNWLVHSILPIKSWSRAPLVVTLHDYSLVCPKKRFMYQTRPCDGPGFKCLACAGDHYGIAKGIPTVAGNRLISIWEKKAVDMFLPVSHSVAAGNGLSESGVPYQVIPNFVADETGALSSETSSYLAQLPCPGYLLYVGDLTDDKGTGILLRAYEKLKNAPPLVLIGRNHLSDYRLPRNVVALKSWPHDAVMAAWRQSSLALVPSVWQEPFGLVAIEAMSAGRPVIASNTGGLADSVVDGETGLLVPPGDADALAAAIERLLNDVPLQECMGQAGKRRSSEFRSSVIVPRIEQVYRKLVERGT